MVITVVLKKWGMVTVVDVVERLVNEECGVDEDMIRKEQSVVLADQIWSGSDLTRSGLAEAANNGRHSEEGQWSFDERVVDQRL